MRRRRPKESSGEILLKLTWWVRGTLRTALAETLEDHALSSNCQAPSPWLTLAQQATDKFKDDPSGRSPWWSCPVEKIERLFEVLSQSRQPVVCPLTDADLTGDIERIIRKTVTPYVDPSNPMLNLDELQAECRAKLARIIDGGRLAQCPTRGKMFAFVKTSFRNHVRSLVQKYAFTAKRTGVEPPPRLPLGTTCVEAGRKVHIIRLDDPSIGHQVGHDDDHFLHSEVLEELFTNLEPTERVQLTALMERANTSRQDLANDGRSLNTERKLRRTLLQKCRMILMR